MPIVNPHRPLLAFTAAVTCFGTTAIAGTSTMFWAACTAVPWTWLGYVLAALHVLFAVSAIAWLLAGFGAFCRAAKRSAEWQRQARELTRDIPPPPAK